MTTADRFRAAVEAGDLTALEDLFAADIRFYSPVKFKPFVGKRMVLGLLGVLLRNFEDFHYIGQFDGSAQSHSDEAETASDILLFRTNVNGRKIHGIDMLHFNDEGKIREFTVMVRPQSAVHELRDAVFAGLVADGLVPAPADA